MKYSENCVYAVRTPEGVKIGMTSRLGDRLSAFQKQHNVACYPIALSTGHTRKEAFALEKSIHVGLSNKSNGCEYFTITDKQAIRALS